MPVSDYGNKKPTIALLKKHNARTILELGVGYGDFGPILTENIEGCKLFGIEIYKPYFEQIPQHLYAKVFQEDMRTFDYKKFVEEEHPEAVLLIDSLEHLDRQDGVTLLKKLEQLFGLIIISVPVIDYINPEFENEWEEHKTQWKIEELLNLGYTIEYVNGVIGVFYKRVDLDLVTRMNLIIQALEIKVEQGHRLFEKAEVVKNYNEMSLIQVCTSGVAQALDIVKYVAKAPREEINANLRKILGCEL
jgi:hypothetical protein